MREIITDWTTPAGSSFVAVMYFEEGAHAVADQREALGDMWRAIDADLANTVSWSVRQGGRELDLATGTLTGFWNESAAQAASGGGSPTPVPDASQILLQWRTGFVLDGREVRGRTFVPGLRYDAVAGGNINGTVVSSIATAAQGLIDAAVGFGVWHRPGPSGPGSHVLAQVATCWEEMAVQRGRRA